MRFFSLYPSSIRLGFFGFFLCSFFLHLFLGVALSPLLTSSAEPTKDEEELILTIEPPPQSQIIITDTAKEKWHENKETPLLSDKTTTLQSKKKGEQEIMLPEQSGDALAEISFKDNPKSLPQKESPSPPPYSLKPPTTQESEKKPKNEGEDSKKSLTQDLSETEKPSPTKIKPPAPSLQPPASMPAPFFPLRVRVQIRGGKSAEYGASSPQSSVTEISRYQTKILKTIGTRWHLLVSQYSSMLKISSVKMRFRVSSNGKITKVETINSDSRGSVLENISRVAIQKAGPFEVFPEALKTLNSESYEEEISFVIY